MALVLADRVRETSTTTGTGTFTLAGAVAGFQSFSAIGNANTTYYTITDLLGNFEVGIGTYTASGTSLSRTTVLSSSNANALVSFPAGTKDVFVTYPAEKSVNYNEADNVVIAANTTTAALTVTQTGTGNAFVVEDSGSPDATPFIVDFAGGVIQGNATFLPTDNYAGNSIVPNFQKHGGAISSASIASTLWNSGSGSNAGGLVLSRSKSATIGTNASVVANDTLGTVSFNGDDGTSFISSSYISGAVDGTPGTDVMPGRLVFATTPAGASAPTERMRIDSAGQVSIGTSAAAAGTTFRLSKNITGAATAQAVNANGAIQSDVTGGAQIFRSSPSTQATTFTLGSLDHFQVNPQAFGAGSTVTNQYGFNAASSLTGATNNYGFYGNIPAGTGRYNLYMAGTAENYLGGNTVINVNNNTNAALRITQLGTGNALLVEDSASPDSTPVVITNAGFLVAGYTDASSALLSNTKLIQSHAIGGSAGYTATRWDATANGPQLLFGKSRGGVVGTLGIVAAEDILGQIVFSGDDGVDLVTSGAQIIAKVDGTPGLNDMPGRLEFLTTADGASAPTERMRIDSAGNVGIGTSLPSYKLHTVGAVAGGAVWTGTSNTDATANSTAGFIAVANGTNNYGALYNAVGGSTYLLAAGAGGMNINVSQAAPILFNINSTERMRIDSSGNVGIGTSSPADVLQAVKSTASGTYRTRFILDNQDQRSVIASYYQAGVAQRMIIQSTAVTGTVALPIAFEVGNTEAMRIDSSGNALVTSPAGLGYGTGSGGTVTQATSKSTAVTLNKPTGQITMNNAALAAGATVTFVFNNFLISATDTMVVNVSGGSANPDAYFVRSRIAAGACAISIVNQGGISLSDALQINFAIIKGATA